MKKQRFDFNWKPLRIEISLSVEGSVPGSQNYDADNAEYTPDYTITPLVLQPRISVIEKDGIIAAGSINHSLANIRWYEIINGTKTQILSSNTNYEITDSGGFAGKIKLKKNVAPQVPITLVFYAEYVDARNGQINVIQATYIVKCASASNEVRVELSAAEENIYNPLKDSVSQAVTATVWLADAACPASDYALQWEILGDDNTWRVVGSDETIDYQVSINGNTATINRKLMGAEMYLRCRVKYDAGGNPGSVTLSAASPQAMCAFVRRISKFEYDISGVPVNIPAGILAIAPTAIIRDTNGEIANAENELLPLWYIATNKGSGSLSYALAGHGSNPILPTTAFSNTYGAVIALDVKDRGYFGAWTDAADNDVICDADGKVLLIH